MLACFAEARKGVDERSEEYGDAVSHRGFGGI
jgi:hypothetical protein